MKKFAYLQLFDKNWISFYKRCLDGFAEKNSWANKQSPIINDDFIIVTAAQTNQSLVKSLCLCTQPSNR